MMRTVFPIFLILCLAAITAVVVHRRTRNFWLMTLLSALLATLLWVNGSMLFIYVTAPGEPLGSILLLPVLYTFLTALAPAAAVAWFFQRRAKRRTA